MNSIYSETTLGKMSFEELADQCLNACIRKDTEVARRIYFDDVQAKLKLTAEKDRKDAILKAFRAQVRMREAIEAFFPEECIEEVERPRQEQAAPVPW